MSDLASTRSRLRHHGLANRRTLRWLGLSVALLVAGMLWSGAGHLFAKTALQCPFDERWAGYSVAQARATLDAVLALGPSERQRYTLYRLLDLPLPWLLGAWLVGALRRAGAPRLAQLGWWAAAVDSLENIALWQLWLGGSPAADTLFVWASAFTQLKWVAYSLTVGAWLIFWVRRWQRPPLMDSGATK